MESVALLIRRCAGSSPLNLFGVRGDFGSIYREELGMSNVVQLTGAPIENPNEAPELDPWDAFWTLYPRHECKKDAALAWSKISTADHVAILVAITQWRKIWAAENRQRHMTPLPATWLRAERWEDEVPPEFSTATRAPATTSMPELPRKSGEIPAFVLAQIAKLKAGK